MYKQSSKKRKEYWTKSQFTWVSVTFTWLNLSFTILKSGKCPESCLIMGDLEEIDNVVRVALGEVGRALGFRIRDRPLPLPLWTKQSCHTVACISVFNKQSHWLVTDLFYTSPLADSQIVG